jgi:hypothetical protein
MVYVPPPTYIPTQTVVPSDWNTYVRDNLKALASKCGGSYGASFSVAAGLTANMPCNSQLYDSADDMFNPAASGRITCKQAGTYRIRYEAGAPVGNGWTIFVKKNGTTTVASKTVGAGFEGVIDWPVAMIVGDYVEPWATAAAGPNITSIAQLTTRPPTVMVWFGADWVSP